MNGSYTVINIEAYNPQDNVISFNAVVYRDSTKKSKVTELRYQFKGLEKINTIPNRGISSPLPLAPELGDKVLVGPNPSGDLAAYDHGTQLTWLGEENSWIQTEKLIEDEYFYIEEEDAYAQWVGGEFYVLNSFFTSAIWATYFDLNIIDQAGQTLLKSCYDYLKTLPEFANAVDA